MGERAEDHQLIRVTDGPLRRPGHIAADGTRRAHHGAGRPAGRAGQANTVIRRPSRSVWQIVRANVLTRLNAIGVLLAVATRKVATPPGTPVPQPRRDQQGDAQQQDHGVGAPRAAGGEQCVEVAHAAPVQLHGLAAHTGHQERARPATPQQPNPSGHRRQSDNQPGQGNHSRIGTRPGRRLDDTGQA
jgi:hypothetical protein